MCATTKYVSETWMSTGMTASQMPERPPITNVNRNPSAHSIGVARLITPPYSVATHENTLMPVGTAISIVVIMIGTRSHGCTPATNMWCAQTENPSTPIDTVENASAR